jgi:hypothetical protein
MQRSVCLQGATSCTRDGLSPAEKLYQRAEISFHSHLLERDLSVLDIRRMISAVLAIVLRRLQEIGDRGFFQSSRQIEQCHYFMGNSTSKCSKFVVDGTT